MMHPQYSDNDIGSTLDNWQEQVLNLTRRNNLVDFTETKTKSLPLEGSGPATVAKMLVGGGDVGLRRRDSESAEKAEADADGILVPNRAPEDAEKSLTAIRHKHRQYLRERGVDTLFLSLGVLRWTHSQNEEALRSPLFLVPVELQPQPTSGVDCHSYRIHYAGKEPIQSNPALDKKLDFERGVTLEHEEFLPERFATAMDSVQELAESFPGWEVIGDVALCIFDFANISLYEDIERNKKALAADPLVRAIAGDPTALHDSVNSNGGDKPHDDGSAQYQVLESDPSQRRAIDAAVQGKSFVLQGPPGTGKSQTIANIIAEKLGRGKQVLFVSEKQAALDVVKHRLSEVGVGRFCLEVHGEHATKSSVINSLKREMQADTVEEPITLDRLRSKRSDVRKSLDAYHDLLTTSPDGFQMTPYEALGRISQMEGLPEIPAGITDPFSCEGDEVADTVDSLRQLEQFKDPIDNLQSHPWRHTSIEDWQVDYRQRMERSLDEQIAALKKLDSLGQQLHQQFGIDIYNPEDMQSALGLLEQLAFTPRDIWQTEFTNPSFYAKDSALRRLANAVQEIERLESYLRDRYEPTVWEEDGSARQRELSEYGIFRYVRPSYYRLKRLLHSHARDGYSPNFEQLQTDMRKLWRLQTLRQKVDDADVDEIYLEPFDNGSGVDWELLLGVQDWIRNIVNSDVVPHASTWDPSDLTNLEEINRLYQQLLETADRHTTARGFFDESMQAEKITVDETPFLETDIETRIEYLQFLRDELDRLQNWVQFQNRRQKLRNTLAGTYLENFLAAGHDPDILAAGFEHEFVRAWLNALYERTPLSTFNGDEFDHYVEEYRSLDEEIIQKTSLAVQHAVTHQQPDVEHEYANSSEQVVLNRELQKQQNWRSLRELFADAGHAVQQLKPCFMMSPLTVARYLEFGTIEFDVVIFDEASQIPPAKAVSALIRADQVIVGGDSNQLPPTRFFETDLSDASDGRTDLESILDETAAVLPERRLSWHYRSKSTDLIQFSNERYYDGRLKTFPETDPGGRTGLQFEYVEDGVYDRGGSRTNDIEAERVVDIVEHHSSESPEQSLGIVAFSRAQEREIREQLKERRTENSDLDEFVSNGDIQEEFFIKSLEVVQGDERDRIIFSIGYGPDQNGEVTMNFGPLNESGGERRLNVAVTRAREQITVVSSLQPEEIDAERTTSRGVTDFKRYLSYVAETANAAPSPSSGVDDDAFSSPIERDVYETLTAAGLSVDPDPPGGGYTLDMAIRDPESPEQYLLGIECDGSAEQQTETTRERDRLRQKVLEELGWQLFRVWAPDWAVDSGRESQHIFETVSAMSEWKSKKLERESEKHSY